MSRMIIVMVIALGLLPIASLGAPSKKGKVSAPPNSRKVATTGCQKKVWQGPRNLSKQQWVAQLSKMPRSEIREVAWGELLSNNPQPIFPFLFIYLAKTEANDLLAGYYEGVLYIMNQNTQWRKVAENWPRTIDLNYLDRTYWTLEKLCSEYQRAGGVF